MVLWLSSSRPLPFLYVVNYAVGSLVKDVAFTNIKRLHLQKCSGEGFSARTVVIIPSHLECHWMMSPDFKGLFA